MLGSPSQAQAACGRAWLISAVFGMTFLLCYLRDDPPSAANFGFSAVSRRTCEPRAQRCPSQGPSIPSECTFFYFMGGVHLRELTPNATSDVFRACMRICRPELCSGLWTPSLLSSGYAVYVLSYRFALSRWCLFAHLDLVHDMHQHVTSASSPSRRVAMERLKQENSRMIQDLMRERKEATAASSNPNTAWQIAKLNNQVGIPPDSWRLVRLARNQQDKTLFVLRGDTNAYGERIHRLKQLHDHNFPTRRHVP